MGVNSIASRSHWSDVHSAEAALQFSGGVGRHRDVAIELGRTPISLTQRAKWRAKGALTEKRLDVVVHALAGRDPRAPAAVGRSTTGAGRRRQGSTKSICRRFR